MTFYYLSRCLIGIFQTLLFYTIEKENIEIIQLLELKISFAESEKLKNLGVSF